MTLTMPVTDPHVVHALVAGTLTLLIGFYPYYKRPNTLTRRFALSNAALALFFFVDLMVLFPMPHHRRVLLDRLCFLPNIAAIPLFIRFVSSFVVRKARWIERWWSWVWKGAVVLIFVSQTPLIIADLQPTVYADEIPGPLFPLFILYFIVSVVPVFYALWGEHAVATGQKREQLRYLWLAMAVPFVVSVACFVCVYTAPSLTPSFYELQILYVVIVSYAILSHKLLDLGTVIKRTLIYSLVSMTLAAFSLFILVLLGKSLDHPISWRIVMSTAISAVVLTLIFHPLYGLVKGAIDRLFSKQQVDRQLHLAMFSEGLTDHLSITEMASALEHSIEAMFRPEHWVFYFREQTLDSFNRLCGRGPYPEKLSLDNPWSRQVARLGAVAFAPFDREKDDLPETSPAAEPWPEQPVEAAVPILAKGELLGFLLLGAKRSQEAYDAEEAAILTILANEAAVVCEQPQLLREVSGGFVHEIKLPLTKIVLPAEMSLFALDDVEKGKKAWEDVSLKIAENLRFVIQQALMASRRLDAIQELHETAEPVAEPVDLGELVHNCLKALEPQMTKTDAAFSVIAPPNGCVVKGNMRQLEVVIVNLVKNALEALDGGEPRRIHIAIDERSDRAWLSVQDSGPGIPENKLDSIFKPYVTSKAGGHRGLGLALVAKIVQAHGGTVRARNAEKAGAVFEVTLPIWHGSPE